MPDRPGGLYNDPAGFADDELSVGDCAVNLPASYRPLAVREAEDGYLERLLELRTRQSTTRGRRSAREA